MSSQKFRFVIIEKDSFVAHDMREGLKAAVPGCDTHHLTDLDGASGLVTTDAEAGSPRTVIVTKLSLAQLDSSGLTQLAQQMRAEIVVRLGEDPRAAVTERGWLSLASPFTWEDLAGLASDLGRRPTAA
ncbi:hypothetical protein [Paracoccus marinaquae]|uniref:Response regulatory domain-containing protein n=1 Tax=Paracoccus marinaquae TaxID=2841926 RepID=A0ABS6AI62_9RHOB|nr:hypothetical protein [Paracoccus marinaquae]MBU3030285.1 hypothetical protein [Paracoccus marinaquae]